MFRIELTKGAIEDLRFLKKFEQRFLLTAIERQLTSEPEVPTGSRKLLRPNELARWELKIGTFRVFYDVGTAAGVVQIKSIGWKEHNKLLIRGKEFRL
jgi:mRNA-degrading endonuclease RelE of RelBE toxin-antitoxin system